MLWGWGKPHFQFRFAPSRIYLYGKVKEMFKMICSFCKQDLEIGHSCVTEIKDIKDLPYPLQIDENRKLRVKLTKEKGDEK